MQKHTKTVYSVRLVRVWSGSHVTIEVRAVGKAQRIAQDQFPGWQIEGIA